MRKAKLILLKLIFLTTLSTAQSLDWVRSFGAAENDEANAMVVGADNNIYITGFFRETVDFDPGDGVSELIATWDRDIFVQKLNANGDLLWAKSMGGGAWEEGRAIAVDDSSNVYITGYFDVNTDFDPGPEATYLSGRGTRSIFIQKLSAAGNLLWVKSVSGSGWDEGLDIAVDALGNVYTTGFFRNKVDFDPNAGVSDLDGGGAFIQKLDPEGNFLWAKSMAGWDNRGFSIAVDDSGNVYSTGHFTDTVDFDPNAGVYHLIAEGDKDIFIQKLDTDGHLLWAKSMGGAGADYGLSLKVDALGNVYTTGYYEAKVDFDPNAGIQSLEANGERDVFVQKLDAAGNLLWVKSVGGTETDWGSDIALDALGSVYTTGSFRGKVDFDPSDNTCEFITDNTTDMFIQKLDASGNFQWAKSMRGPNLDRSNSIALDASGNIYTAGGFQGIVDFDPNIGLHNLAAEGERMDIFIQKLKIEKESPLPQVKVQFYPNPSSGLFVIELPNGTRNVSLEIVDDLGRIMERRFLSKNRNEMDLSHLAAGVYHLVFDGGEEQFHGKVILIR